MLVLLILSFDWIVTDNLKLNLRIYGLVTLQELIMMVWKKNIEQLLSCQPRVTVA